MIPIFHHLVLTRLIAALSIGLAAASCVAQGLGSWEVSPYAVRVMLAVDVQQVDAAGFGKSLAEKFTERAEATVGALWALEVAHSEPSDIADVISMSRGELSDSSQLPPAEQQVDKTIVVGVQESVHGLRVSVIEHDSQLLRWGPSLAAEVATVRDVPEAVFRLALKAFSPIAQFAVNGKQVDLTFRGQRLPTRPGAPEWVRPDDVFVPVLRRLDKNGNIFAEGVRPVPWTYLHVYEGEEGLTSKFVSHTRRPLASRKRGRVDYLAVRLPRESSPTTLRIHDKDDETRPLVGYHVYTQDGDDAPRQLVGSSGADGRVTIQPGKSRILLAYVKSGALLVAKLPVVPGSVNEMNVPLLDESPRLNAEAKLGLLREDLIDLVAQRQLYIAQINNAIEDKKLDAAGRMIDDLEALPGVLEFDRQLRQLEGSSQSDIKMVQKRIDQIFADTRTVLTAFLDRREIQELKTRLLNARK